MARRTAFFCAAIFTAGPASAELLSFEETPAGARATIRIEGSNHALDVKLLRSKIPASGGALLVDIAQQDHFSAMAAGRGMTVARLDLGGLPRAARAEALRDLVPRLKAASGAKRALAYGAGENVAALAEVSGLFDGLLLQDAPPGAVKAPRLIEVWGGDAYWRAAPRQAPAATEPENRRSFFIAGTIADCPGAQGPALRALLVALDDWTKGVKPPASRVPAGKDLVAAASRVWPKLPGLPAPPGGQRMVPKIDADGNEASGLRLPDRALPIATFAAFAAQQKPGTAACAGASSPFPATRADREKAGDPRASLVERYGSRAYFVATLRVVSDKLVKERLLLKEDADAYVAAGKQAPF